MVSGFNPDVGRILEPFVSYIHWFHPLSSHLIELRFISRNPPGLTAL
jgi:hypothetical protein